MNALFYNVRKRFIHYVQKNFLLILLISVPFIIMILTIPTQRTHISLDEIINLDARAFDAFTVIFSFAYFIITLLNLDYLPLTKPEASYFFTAPIRNQYTLLYLLLKSLMALFIALFFISYSAISQMPALFGFTNVQMVRLMISLFMSMFMCLSMSFMLLAIRYKRPLELNIFKYIVIIIAMLVFSKLATIIYFFIMENLHNPQPDLTSLLNEVVGFLTMKIFYYTPFLGFVLSCNKFVYNGNILGLMMPLAASMVCIFITFKINFSLTDKALEIAEKFEKLRARKKGAEQSLPEFFSSKFIDESKPIKGYGMSSLISKFSIEYIRRNNLLLTSKNILFLGIMLLILIIIQMTTGQLYIETEEGHNVMFYTIMAVIYTLSLIPDKTTDELYLPIMRLLPFSNTKKLFAQFFYNCIPNIVQGVLIFIFLFIYDWNLLNSIYLCLVLVSLLFACTSVDFLLGSIFPDNALVMYRILISIFLKIFIWLASFVLIMIVSFESMSILVNLIIVAAAAFIIFVCLTISAVIIENK